jgi:hypothetical protein
MLTGKIFASCAKTNDLESSYDKLSKIKNIEAAMASDENLVLQNIMSRRCYYFGKDPYVEKANSLKFSY